MPERRPLVIAIDGPSGVGKSTISRRLAAVLGLTYLDTGAMYRAVAWHIREHRIDPADGPALETALADLSIELVPAAGEAEDVGVRLDGVDISDRIRTPEISMLASTVSANPAVRARLTRLQQEYGRRGGVVAEGRDTTTVVFPSAPYKFYLDATPEERARRRALQLRERGQAVDERELLQMTLARDRQDSERALAPLKKAEDGVVIDTTDKTVEQVLAAIVACLEG